MEKLKKYFKMIVDEIKSADEYADMAAKFKSTDSALSEDYHEIAEQELHHKEVLEKTVKRYIDDCKNESGESCADMEVIFDFVKDVSESMVEPIRAKLK